MTNSLTKYQLQAARLGLQDIDANDIHMFLLKIIMELRSLPSAGSRTLGKRAYTRLPDGTRDETTLYYFYAGMIDDTVRQINKKRGRAYVFSIEQIADVIKYEKNAQFIYLPDSDCFMVTK